MKKIFLTVGVLGAALAIMPMFAAFEAHVVNVTATIENALSVPLKEIRFGTTFPQEQLDKTFDVSLSSSFLAADRVDDIEYFIRQKPKCGLPIQGTNPVQYSEFEPAVEDRQGNFSCANVVGTNEGTYVPLPLLCPYLSKHEITTDGARGENDGAGLSAFHGPIDLASWNLDVARSVDVLGRLSKAEQDTSDTWNIDLKVPCFAGQCAQDWAKFVTGINPTAHPADYVQPSSNEHKLFGCDLWVEVKAVSTNDNLLLGACGKATGFSVSGHMLNPTTYDYVIDGSLNTVAGDAADHAWLHLPTASAEAVWDMGSPQSAVWLVPSIDHGPVPEEGNETLLYGGATPVGPWTLGTHTTVVTNGPSDWISDDHTNKWTFGTPYRYIRGKSTAFDPTATTAQGLFLSTDTEVDAVCNVAE